jgi:galactonate dehydratase
MKIRNMETFRVKQPKNGLTYTLVKVSTDDGVSGWGDCSAAGPADVGRVLDAIRGEPASRFEVIRTKLDGLPGGVRSAVLMALVDIVGQTSKSPAYQVMGGPTRSRVRAMTEWSEAAAKTGHKAFLVGAQYEPQSGFDYVVDGRASMTPNQASLLAVQLEKLHPLWLDEPCPPTAARALQKISEESVTPLGWGAHVNSLSEVQDLLREQVIDVVRLSLSRHDLWSIRKAAALAETYYTAVAPGPGPGPVSAAAAIHLAASLPNFFIQQIPWSEGDDANMRAEIAGAPIERVKDGYFALPTGPGLGLRVSEAAVRRYAA